MRYLLQPTIPEVYHERALRLFRRYGEKLSIRVSTLLQVAAEKRILPDMLELMEEHQAEAPSLERTKLFFDSVYRGVLKRLPIGEV